MAESPRRTGHIKDKRDTIEGTLRSKTKESGRRTCIMVADPSEVPSPIQLATSSILGTVAETTRKRTEDPRVFIRESITSRVLPRDSLRICTCGERRRVSASERETKLIDAYFVDKEELDL